MSIASIIIAKESDVRLWTVIRLHLASMVGHYCGISICTGKADMQPRRGACSLEGQSGGKP